MLFFNLIISLIVRLMPSCSYSRMDEIGKPQFSSVTNLSVSPEVSNKINKARSLFGGSAFTLNKINDRPLTPTRHASSATDLTDTNVNTNSNGNDRVERNSKSNSTAQTKHAKPLIKTPVKFPDELKVITQNNEPAKKSTFGYIFKNFFK